MFASICIQLQELTKEKPPGRDFPFPGLCLLPGTLTEHLLTQNANWDKDEEVAECEGEIRGEEHKMRTRGGGGEGAPPTSGRPGTAPSEPSVVPRWLTPAPREGRAPGSPPSISRFPPAPLCHTHFEAVSALFIWTNDLGLRVLGRPQRG